MNVSVVIGVLVALVAVWIILLMVFGRASPCPSSPTARAGCLGPGHQAAQ